LRILIADDQREVRSAVRLLIEQELQFADIAEAADTDSLRRLLSRSEPTLLILDWELCATPGECIAAVRLFSSVSWVIVISSHPEARQDALQTGADGFVCKGDAPDVLISALIACGVSAPPPHS
jgi:DNA-binding NarL/FixJ family response regulator